MEMRPKRMKKLSLIQHDTWFCLRRFRVHPTLLMEPPILHVLELLLKFVDSKSLVVTGSDHNVIFLC